MTQGEVMSTDQTTDTARISDDRIAWIWRHPFEVSVDETRAMVRELQSRRSTPDREPSVHDLEELAAVIDDNVGGYPLHMERMVWEYVVAALKPSPSQGEEKGR